MIFQGFFFEILPKFSDFVNSNNYIGKITSKSIGLCATSFYSTQDFKWIKNRFFLLKKWEIQVIVLMITLTRSSERILNPMRLTRTYEFIHELNLHDSTPSPFRKERCTLFYCSLSYRNIPADFGIFIKPFFIIDPAKKIRFHSWKKKFELNSPLIN